MCTIFQKLFLIKKASTQLLDRTAEFTEHNVTVATFM